MTNTIFYGIITMQHRKGAIKIKVYSKNIKPTNAENILRRAEKYFRYCDTVNQKAQCGSCKYYSSENRCAECRVRYKKPYTFAGLCCHLGLTKNEFLEMAKDPALAHELDMILLRIQAYMEENTFVGNLSASAASALMKEQSEMENVLNKSDAPLQIVMADELASFSD